MSAYAAAYAPPPGMSGKGGSTSATSNFGKGGGKTGGYGYSSGAPTSFAPPGASKGTASTPGFSYSGLAGADWPSAEQLVASVPVRPFDFKSPSQKISIGTQANVSESRGVVPKPFAVGEEAEFFLLKGALADGQMAEILATGCKSLGASIASGKCRELDPTDGRPRFNTDLVSDGIYDCGDLELTLQPIVDDILLPYIREKYACPGAALACAKFRRFVPEERRFVPPHHEYNFFALASLGLQDPATFTGGLFVQGSGRAFLDRKFVPLSKGDICVYRHDLYHGVEVQESSYYELTFYFKDSREAAFDDTCTWYSRAAEAGDASAQYGLALSALCSGDYQDARSWLEKACAQDHPEALYTHADMIWEPPSNSSLQADTARGLQLLRRAAELGHGRAQSRLGGMLVSGVKGRVQQDSWEGKRLLRLAFEQDDPEAAFNLGQALIQEGDRDGATKLLAACAKGHPRACFMAAEMYREGQYQFPKDMPQSLRYTKWAAHQGDPQALSNLGNLLINGLGVIRDDAKAVRLFRHSAKLGAMEGQLNYGLALLRGNGGVKIDYQEALVWAQKAAAQGHSLAHQQLPMFFNAAKNPNPPARSVPSSSEELARLSVKELREFLKTEGIDFSDCVEKADLIARASQHLPGVEEPWDPAPEHTLLLEPPKKTKADLLKARQQQAESTATAQSSTPQRTPEETTPQAVSSSTSAVDAQVPINTNPSTNIGGSAARNAFQSEQTSPPYASDMKSSVPPMPTAHMAASPIPVVVKAEPLPTGDDEFECID